VVDETTAASIFAGYTHIFIPRDYDYSGIESGQYSVSGTNGGNVTGVSPTQTSGVSTEGGLGQLQPVQSQKGSINDSISGVSKEALDNIADKL
jgi:hypothetical protein